ncbi:MAG TPA: hypothetical protein VGD66_01310 [Allosphingosinicella sp.]|jgi:hypothetical protein
MNRFAPLILRAPPRSGRARAWAIEGFEEAATTISADLRLFATAFAAGLIVFSTLLA